jgi:phosphatidylserine/phosphatidylglycerophosphate/cardiolipin synthase-like enzyme
LYWSCFCLFSCLASSPAFADFSLEVSEAPTSNLNLTVGAIRSAKQSILLNIYELSSPEIADALVSQIQAGVHVEILEEGQPVGGMSAAAKGIESQINQAMQQAGNGDHFFVMTSKGGTGTSTKRRYHFDHAKYAVIDGGNLLIGSENYSPTGNPDPGTKGNRGWEVFLHEPAIAANYASVFRGDADTSYGDVIDLTSASINPNAPADQSGNRGNPPSKDGGPDLGQSLQATTVSRVSSPDSSQSGLVALLNSAQTSIDIEQMTFDSSWSNGNNPLIDALRSAAGRGVKIRVLLNDESVFDHGGKPGERKNPPTVSLLNTLPNATARIANLNAMGVDFIHNKGVLVDGKLTLISSINWDENSITRNREAAVVITSPEVFQHYESLFNSDWNASAQSGTAANPPFGSLQPRDASGDNSAACPASLRVRILVDELTIDRDDDSFASLSGSTLEGRFLKSPAGDCSYESETGGSSETIHKRYLELRPRDGLMNFDFEGYTARGNKLYSIRAKLDWDSAFLDGFTAQVFNGSATKEFLGLAQVKITETEW